MNADKNYTNTTEPHAVECPQGFHSTNTGWLTSPTTLQEMMKIKLRCLTSLVTS